MRSQPAFPAMPDTRDEQTALWHLIERRRLAEAGLEQAALIDELADLHARMRRLDAWLAGGQGVAETSGQAPFVMSGQGRVTADAHFPAAHGFYSLETEESGRPFRWTGPLRDFTFDLALDRTLRWTGTLHVLGAIKNELVDGMVLYADADMLPLQTTTDDDGYHLAFTLPSRQGDNAVRLTFGLPGVLRPCDMGLGADERALGVRFHALDMESA